MINTLEYSRDHNVSKDLSKLVLTHCTSEKEELVIEIASSSL